jgi:choline-glycine betaine transporter
MAKLGRMKNINPVFSTDDDDFFAVGFFLLLVMLALTCACFKHIDNKEAAHNKVIEQQIKAEEATQHKQELQAIVKEAVREEMEKENMRR